MRDFTKEELKQFKEEARKARERKEKEQSEPGYSREWDPDLDWGLE